MKKFCILIAVFMSAFCMFGQAPKTDKEIKDYLVENGFNCFKFNANGTYSYSQKGGGEVLSGEGTYSVKNGIVIFETLGNHFETPVYGKSFAQKLKLPGKYIIDFEIQNAYYQGALINVNDSEMILWSLKAPDFGPGANEKIITINGVKCIKYPTWDDEQAGRGDRGYIVLLENLKLRSQPTTSSSVVSVTGYDNEVGFSSKTRSIEYAGKICTVIAKTVEKTTIDGITAPWYMITAYGCDDMGLDFQDAWIFGGYVKEFKSKDLDSMKHQYTPLLEQSIQKAGGYLKNPK